jgi:surface protein
MALYLEVDYYYQMRGRVLRALLSCLMLVFVTTSGLFLLLSPVHAAPADEFVTTWKTDNPGSSGSTEITIPTTGGGYNYNVDWDNDGIFDEFSLTGDVTHDFGTPGEYTIRIEGDFPRIYFNNAGDKDKIIRIEQWGTNPWTSMSYAFAGTTNLTGSASDAPNLTNVTDMSYMFSGARLFNQDVSSWNTSNVLSMDGLFSGTQEFNQALSSWDTASVTNMQSMFSNASAFNGDISTWNTGNVTNMSYMFSSAVSFDRDISSWDTGNVINMDSMFAGATAFNKNLTGWNTSNVTSMSDMFEGASAFNGDISTWNTGSVTDMRTMFFNAVSFDRDISSWDTGNVTDMTQLFAGATAFNKNLTGWNTSNVTSMGAMFAEATSFNGDVSTWDTSKVTRMDGTFSGATSFNGDVSDWNTSNVTSTGTMFWRASSFNGDVSAWDMSNVTYANSMLASSGLSIANYDAALISWSLQNLQQGVAFDAQDLAYCAGSDARQTIINNFGWNIHNDVGCEVRINNTNAGTIESGSEAGTSAGVLSATHFTVRTNQPYSISCTTAGADDSYFTIGGPGGDSLLTNTEFDFTMPVDADANNIYEVCVRATNAAGAVIEKTIPISVTPVPTIPEGPHITGVEFSTEAGRKTLTVSGTNFLGDDSMDEIFVRSFVTLNGVDLPFCADGTGYTAQQLIDLYKQAFNVDITGRVSDNPPCYYYIHNGGQALTPTQALVWLPDNFDTTAEGTVSVNGSNTYTFNAASPENAAPTAMINGDKPLNQTPNVSRRPVFSGVANPGATVLVSIDGGAVTCNAVADQSGNWSCTSPSALALGAHTVSITVTEPGGVVTVLGPYNFVVVEGSGAGTSIPSAPNTGFMQMLQKHRTDKDIRQRIVVALVVIAGAFTALVGVRYILKKRTTKVTFSS